MMNNFFSNFKTYGVVEQNISTGLRIGDMIADKKFSKPASGTASESVENGLFFTLQDSGNIALAVKADTNPLYIHYTEELLPVEFLTALKYFTVEYDAEGKAIPRLIKLYAGDTWTVSKFTLNGSDALSEVTYAQIDAGVVKGFKVAPTTEADKGGHVFAAKAVKMPDGITDGLELTFVR